MAATDTTSLQVVQDPERAAAMLHPLRMRMLETLREPHSASSLARVLELPRQRVNYHLRELEKQDLVELVEERRKGNCVERIVRATARFYVISPATSGPLAADPEQIADRFSSSYLLALAEQATRDLGKLRTRARAAGKRLATLSLQTEIRFASAADRNAFGEELARAVARLAARYHDDGARNGRRFRFFVGGYPSVSRDADSNAEESGKKGNAVKAAGAKTRRDSHATRARRPSARSKKPN